MRDYNDFRAKLGLAFLGGLALLVLGYYVVQLVAWAPQIAVSFVAILRSEDSGEDGIRPPSWAFEGGTGTV